MKIEKLHILVQSLVIFRNILQDKVFKKFIQLLEVIDEKNVEKSVDRYAAFAAKLFAEDVNFTQYIFDFIKQDENFYIKRVVSQKDAVLHLQQSLRYELETLQQISKISGEQLQQLMGYDGFLPSWQISDLNFKELYEEHISSIHTNGYGIYAKHHMFVLQNSALKPVLMPDDTKLSELYDYERERQPVVDNTLALLDNKPASNVLLYGDSGTGKSSSIKAILNEYAHKGLRLVEVKKQELHNIPNLIEKLAQNPLKFILFIDDISFRTDDEDFAALKAILEGSALMQSGNIAVYATSNRRHLVRETFSDREGDDVHVSETIQHVVSLSDRFGLTVAFLDPSRREYLAIVWRIAKREGVRLPQEKLSKMAEEFALMKGGRSPRVAKQFVEQLVAGLL